MPPPSASLTPPANVRRIALWRRHAGQRQLWAERRRFNVACMGRRWGKTKMGIDLLLSRGMALEGAPVGWFAPQYKLLEEVYREARRILADVTLAANSQQHRLELITGGTIDFWTLDNPDSGRGRKYALVVVDEAAMARNLEEAWTQAIRPTLADLSGSAWFLSTPAGGNYFKTLYDRAGEEDEWRRWQMPTHTNPHIQPEEIDALRHDLPEIVFRQEVLAEFVDLAGAVVQREWVRHSVPPSGLTVVFGVDLAISTRTEADYTAIVVMARDTQGTVYLLDAQRTQAPFHGVLLFIQQLAAQWKPAIIAIEQVQYQVAVVQELLRTTTLPVTGVRPDKDKLTRFLPLLARYEQRLVCHAPGLPRWFEEELLTFPMGQHDDGCLVAGTQVKTAMGMKPIEEINVGDQVMTRRGYRRVLAAGMTSRNATVFTVSFSNGASLTGTGNHPIMTANGWIELQKMSKEDKISVLDSIHFEDSLVCLENAKLSNITESAITAPWGGKLIDLAQRIENAGLLACMNRHGKTPGTASRWAIKFCRKMETLGMFGLKTLNCCLLKIKCCQRKWVEFINEKARWLSTTATAFTATLNQKTQHIATIFRLESKIEPMALIFCTAKSGKTVMGLSRMDTIFTTKTGISSITPWKIWNVFLKRNTRDYILRKHGNDLGTPSRLNILPVSEIKPLNGIKVNPGNSFIKSMALSHGKTAHIELWYAQSVSRITRPVMQALRCIALPSALKKSCDLQDSIKTKSSSVPLVIGNLPESNDKNIAPVYVLSVIPEALPTAVFNLTVEGEPEYYANGVLVHNCDAASMAFQALPADTIPDYSMGGLSRRFEGAL